MLSYHATRITAHHKSDMRAGQLRYPIDILRHIVERTEYGSVNDKYEFFFKTRADVNALSGGRDDDGREIFYEHTYRFTVRSYVPVTDFDRIYYKEQMYRIINIDDDELLNCKYITAQLVNE